VSQARLPPNSARRLRGGFERALASSTAAAAWSSFTAALGAASGGPYDGIGFVVTADDPFCGIDLDKCVDPVTGAIEAWAQKVIEQINSYSEISPSQTGVRIFVEAQLPGGAGHKRGHIEIYDRARYLTVTGAHVPGTPRNIEARQAEVDALLADVFPVPARPLNGNGHDHVEPTGLEDRDIIERASRARNGDTFRRLYEGDWSAYPSHSEADLALCNTLAFWTGRDGAAMDRIFRSSGLMRPKWDERHFGPRTYGQETIAKASAACANTYTPPPPRIHNPEPVAPAAPAVPARAWPTLDRAALYGLAGRVVATIAEHTEADPVATLAHFLVGFGNLIGDGPHCLVEADRHPCRLNAVIVGDTSNGRKGTAWSTPRQILQALDPTGRSGAACRLAKG
jgi:hypothetical protein